MGWANAFQNFLRDKMQEKGITFGQLCAGVSAPPHVVRAWLRAEGRQPTLKETNELADVLGEEPEFVRMASGTADWVAVKALAQRNPYLVIMLNLMTAAPERTTAVLRLALNIARAVADVKSMLDDLEGGDDGQET